MIDIFLFVFYSFLAACLEMSFQEYQQPRMIFSWYHNYLIRFAAGECKPLWKKKIVLVLGLCPYCNGFWVAVVVYLLTFEFNLLNLLLFTGLNYFFIILLIKIKR